MEYVFFESWTYSLLIEGFNDEVTYLNKWSFWSRHKVTNINVASEEPHVFPVTQFPHRPYSYLTWEQTDLVFLFVGQLALFNWNKTPKSIHFLIHILDNLI